MTRKIRLYGAAALATLAIAPLGAQAAMAAGGGGSAPPTSDARGDFCKPWHPPCA
jgi:hypothetical protein